ncbi:hypothetical protein FHG87_018462 [Trinorchestia longiramus]|nr:hypothetical protein FHG87_018462 [Trinorchestia longiramus]
MHSVEASFYKAVVWALLPEHDRSLANVVFLVVTGPSLVVGFTSSVLFAHWSMKTRLIAVLVCSEAMRFTYSDDGLETAPQVFAGLDNVVRVHGHPLPVNRCFKGDDVWVANATDLTRPKCAARRRSLVDSGLASMGATCVLARRRNSALAENPTHDWMCVLEHYLIEAQQ